MSDTVRQWIAESRQLVVLTRAGMSAESGVPTFRGAMTGLWAQFRPEELATEQAFRAHPQRVWDWYLSRRETVALVEPNAGHKALAAFQSRHPGRLTLITQNVDGLHQRAGSAHTIALHGALVEDQWLDTTRPCCTADSIRPGRPPHCQVCGNLRRPSVVWFGEPLPAVALEAAEDAVQRCDLMLGYLGRGVPCGGTGPQRSSTRCACGGGQSRVHRARQGGRCLLARVRCGLPADLVDGLKVGHPLVLNAS